MFVKYFTRLRYTLRIQLNSISFRSCFRYVVQLSRLNDLPAINHRPTFQFYFRRNALWNRSALIANAVYRARFIPESAIAGAAEIEHLCELRV